MKKFLYLFLSLTILGLLAAPVAYFYSYIFSKTLDGKLEAVERVVDNAVTSNAKVAFAFAVSLRTPDGQLVTSSSEDRQWAVAKPGQCAKAKFFPYPFWDLEKGATYFNARLLKLYDCATNAPSGS